MLSALLAARPWFPRELDDAPEAGWRPFETTDDIRRVATALTRLALRVAIADQALEAMRRLLAAGPAQASVLAADWSRIAKTLGNGRPPLLQNLVPQLKGPQRRSPSLIELLRKTIRLAATGARRDDVDAVLHLSKRPPQRPPKLQKRQGG